MLPNTRKGKNVSRSEQAKGTSERKHEVLGSSLPRIDSWQKVTGEAKFGADIYLPGMLHGKILRSGYPHARILEIDTSRAERHPGVKAVITWRDAPDIKIGMYTDDWRFFAKEKVLYMGDVVAAVAAVDPDIATEAAELIRVEYEELPPIFDPFEAMRPEAVLIHEDVPGNIACRRRIRKGDPDEIFARAEYVFEDSYQTQMVDHCPIEPHVAVAQYDSSGKLVIWSSTQAPFNNRMILSRGLRIPMNRLRIITTNIGGAFGGKQELMAEPSCALLAKKSGCPVKITMDRREEFTGSSVRHPYSLAYKTAVDSNGKILARKIKIVEDLGAYNDLGEGVLRYATLMATGPYSIDHVWVDGIGVYTNKQVGGVMRGVGVPQVCFAGESQLDMIAKEIGIDPYDIRMINALKDGDITANGQECISIGIRETLRRVWEESGYESRVKRKNHGYGLASMMYTCGGAGRHDYSGAVVKINEDATVMVMTGAPDVGQGARTVMAQIAAQELGVKYEDVWVDQPDTDLSPTDLYGANASRMTYIAGNAVKIAASEAKKEILEGASRKWEAAEEDLEIIQGRIYVKGVPEPLGTLRNLVMELHRPQGQTIIGKGSYHTTGVPMDPETGQGHVVDLYLFATQLAEVEVDPETGLVKVLNVWSAHDVGKAINPSNLEGQVEGGIQMGLGFALTEEIVLDQGETLNPSFLDYRMFTSADMPRIKPIIVEVPEPLGPFGARGIGEATTIPTAGAIANAVSDAVGIRIKELPLSPERVLTAIKEKRKG